MININRYSEAEAVKMFDLVSELIQVYRQDRPFKEVIEEDEYVALLTIQNLAFARARNVEVKSKV